jgi:nucleotide-binding universal stress UspA family protein
MGFQHVLLPTDGSELAAEAIPVAVRVLADGGRVTILEVIEDLGGVLLKTSLSARGTPPRTAVKLAEQVVAAERKAAREHLKRTRAALRAAGVTDVKSRITEGPTGPSIIAAAKRLGCDAIVMGTHGRSGLMAMAMGSVAQYVVRQSGGIPVVLVRRAEAG